MISREGTEIQEIFPEECHNIYYCYRKFTSKIVCNFLMFLYFMARYHRLKDHLPYILPSSDNIIFRRPHGGYMASASWKLCSMSGLHTPSASAADSSLSSSQSSTSRLRLLPAFTPAALRIPLPPPSGPSGLPPAVPPPGVQGDDTVLQLDTTAKPKNKNKIWLLKTDCIFNTFILL